MAVSRGDFDSPTTAVRSAAPVIRYCTEFRRALPAALRRHMPFLALILACWIAGLIVCGVTGIRWTKTLTMYFSTFQVTLPLMAMCLLAGRVLVIMIAERPARPLTQFYRELRSSLLSPQRMASAVPILAGMYVFGGTFTVMKAAIPFLAPFSWDVAFEEWDRWLHAGYAPWELLYPLLGGPRPTQVLNWGYNAWLVVLNLVWVWQAFSLRNARQQLQFFMSFVLGWVLLGSAAAMVFSSAGPCFFGRATGFADPYAPLMAHLATVNQTHTLWALNVQEKLWELYATSELGLGAGISAMPSIHVASATLFALIGWRTYRWLGIALTFYAVTIMIGSVHLGWHYAIDGYAGAAGMCAIWWLVGRLLAWWAKRSSTGSAPEAAVAGEVASH